MKILRQKGVSCSPLFYMLQTYRINTFKSRFKGSQFKVEILMQFHIKRPDLRYKVLTDR